MIKAVLLDFDGTLVHRDILDVVCGIVGKETESQQLNREFQAGIRPGLEALTRRINFLKGVTQDQIAGKLREKPYLMTGAKDLVSYLNSRGIITILNSGNIELILRTYQQMLGITYIVGSQPIMDGGTIRGISESQFSGSNFKLDAIKQILSSTNILPSEIVAIGDSPADRPVFKFAGTSIAINPKNGVGEFADHVIDGDLGKAIEIIKKLR